MSKRKTKPPQSARNASRLEHLDAVVATRLGRHHRHPVVRVLGAASEIADQPPLITVSAATAVAGLVLKRPALMRTGLRMVAAELVATGIKHIIKRRVDRTRPHKMIDEGHYRLSHEGSDASKEGPWSSFPSGHTAGAVAVARAITRGHPAAAFPSGIAATTIAAIQVPRRSHFPSDVIAGAAVGFAAEWLVHLAEQGVRRLSSPVRTRSAARADPPEPAAHQAHRPA